VYAEVARPKVHQHEASSGVCTRRFDRRFFRRFREAYHTRVAVYIGLVESSRDRTNAWNIDELRDLVLNIGISFSKQSRCEISVANYG